MEPQSSYLLVNDLRLHYLGWNRGGAGRQILLLHGLASNARIWELVAPELSAKDYELIAPDLRGHGLTDKPDGEYDFDVYAADLAGLVNALDLDHPVLVGHSWGGMLAVDYAARFTSGKSAPAGIVLVDGGMVQLDDFPGVTWEEMRARLTPPRLAGMPLETFLGYLTHPASGWQPDERAIQIILANFEISEDETIYPHLSFDHHMQIVRAMWEFQTYQRFTRVRCPALLLPSRPPEPLDSDEQDYLSLKERCIRRILQGNPYAKVKWMEDSIHDVPLQRPVELAETIADFIRQLPLETRTGAD